MKIDKEVSHVCYDSLIPVRVDRFSNGAEDLISIKVDDVVPQGLEELDMETAKALLLCLSGAMEHNLEGE
jgi:hypothetical protein